LRADRFIGSIGGKVATTLMGPYGASKFAIESIGESPYSDLRSGGISVSVVEPGAVKTPYGTRVGGSWLLEQWHLDNPASRVHGEQEMRMARSSAV